MVTAYARNGFALLTLAALVACGGGGGGGGETIDPIQPPVARTPQTIAYSAGDGLSNNGLTEMYSVDDSGRNQQLLSAAMITGPGSNIGRFEVSPDKRWVAYLADRFTGQNWYSLYVAPIDGGSDAIRVSTQISNGGATNNRTVKSFQWSPDSTQLVYAANETSNISFFANEIYIVNRDGSGRSRINGGIGSPASVELSNPQWSPDGRFIVQEVSDYANGTRRNTHGLNVYDTTTGTVNSRRLFTPRTPVASTVIRNVRWSPDSTRISYMADQLVASQYDLFVIDVVSGANTQLTNNGDFNSDARWSPDGSTLAYLDNPTAPFPSDLIVSAGSAGAQDTVLAFVSANGRSVYDYEWSPNGQRIAYTSDEATENVRELYVINADGSGGASRISGALVDGGDVFKFAWAANGSSIAYLADQTSNTFIDLYVSNVSSGSNTQVSLGLNGEEVVDFAWSDDSQRLAFSTGPDDDNANKLYVSQPNGSGRVEISLPMTSGPLHFEYD